MAGKGLLRRGTIVDATTIAALRSRKYAENARDPRMDETKNRVPTTAAKESDITLAAHLFQAT